MAGFVTVTFIMISITMATFKMANLVTTTFIMASYIIKK